MKYDYAREEMKKRGEKCLVAAVALMAEVTEHNNQTYSFLAKMT